MANVMLAMVVVISTCHILPSLSETDHSLVEWILEEKCSGNTKVQCILGVKYELEKWLEEKNKYSILVVGKIGSGKTTLVKGITNRTKKKKYTPKSRNGSLYAQTLEVAHHEYEHEGMKLSIYDTPGLSEGENGTLDFQYLDKMFEYSSSPDLIIYTIKMDTAAGKKLSAEDIKVMKRVSHTFGRPRWKFSIFVLTFANRVYKGKKPNGDGDSKHYFSQVLNDLRLEIRNSLKSFDVNKNITDDLRIFPVGLVQQSKIKADDRGISSWVTEFWSESVKILQNSRVQKKIDKEKIKQGEYCACPSQDSQEKEDEDVDDNEEDQNEEGGDNEHNEETLAVEATDDDKTEL